METSVPEETILTEFLKTLQALPEIHVERSPAIQFPDGTKTYDGCVDLRVAGKIVTLLIEIKKAVYPKDVGQMIWQWSRTHAAVRVKFSGDTQRVLIAESISPGAKEILRAERIGYFDSGGSLYIPAASAYLYIDRPPPKPMKRVMRSLFSGRRAQVIHALLLHHEDWFGVTDISAKAAVSMSTASNVFNELERFEWVESMGHGPGKKRRLRKPAELLDEWAKQLASTRTVPLRRYFVPQNMATPLTEQVGRVFGHHQVDYAMTHEAAAQCYEPFLTHVSQVRCRLLSGPNVDDAIADLGASVVVEGANLAIIDAKSPGELLFREQIGLLWLASPVQVYLDLVNAEGRAKEAAETLRRERIGF